MTGPLIAKDVDELVRALVQPGEHVHLAATPSRPNALTYALCRTFAGSGKFTVSTTAVHSSAHALALSGCADRVIAGFIGDTYPTPRPNPLYAELMQGRPFTFEAWSLLSYVQRLMAGATGVPYCVTASLSGTDLAADKDGQLYVVPDPAHPGSELTLLSALRPDVTFVHGVCADEDGNVVLVPPYGEGPWAAYAARRGVIASVERIVSRSESRALADRVLIPGQRVIGLCQAELGAHPQSLRTAGLAQVPGYLDDYRFLEDIVDACHGADRGTGWYRTWVTEPGSHHGYLGALGENRRAALTDDIAPRSPEMSGTSGTSAGQADGASDREDPAEPAATKLERLIVLGARAVAERVRSGRYDTVLAGIGASHMAAWLAAELLRDSGHKATVMAELGAYGFRPAGGDVFLFSLRHAETAQHLSGIPEILGGMVSAYPRALGVLAAAEIDETGTINTSLGRDGHWLTGSGGANDIAASADCVVIAAASPRRYVSRVNYRTSRGDRVHEVISQFGRFRRDAPGGEFRLATFLAPREQADPDGTSPTLEEQAKAAVAESTAWSTPVSGVSAESPVSLRELRVLRSLDPEGRYR
jgi:acyl CoA:acetate/3-ketoacid CoA transferase alpha subunit/acyl CoA:acetate/3-ketoacid CoA transferase beta subunit